MEYDIELLNLALQFSLDSRLITPSELDSVMIEVEPPSMQVSDRLKEVQAC